MTDFTQAVARRGQPEAAFEALAALVQETVGAKLFTTTVVMRERGVVRRNFSTMPDAYPVSGEKPLTKDRWADQVEGRHETFVANSIEEIAAVFPDHELIRSLGCESCMNVPIVIDGTVVGTLNCLHEAGHYTREHVARAETLKLPGAVTFLMHRISEKGA
ncbi:GAF domain-containing protein [Wenxinia saemankumensis]|uniref:GAF domain-containing protein n=1 Tax=Wenxinia saemankumensis TaxID=1447782 RepID=A0A1M6I125_9RHOB|nr:GAF domain-containing protein [Wenxinia saemankumensis]SHJ28192.1 GAF domain-containing protein [Wenxinia saemankumensis]